MFKALEVLSSLEERISKASELTMNDQLYRIRSRTSRGIDADGRSFKRKKDGSMPKVASSRLLSSLDIRGVVTGSQQVEVSLSAYGDARKIIGRQNNQRRFLGFGQEDRTKLAEDFSKHLFER